VQEVLEIALVGMQKDAARLDRVAMNIANVMTPAYKRAMAAPSITGRPFAEHLSAFEGRSVEAAPTLFDTRPGTLKPTGRLLDFALTGDGYFEIAIDAGFAYTRVGSFRRDAEGRLVTAAGQAVMGVGGVITLVGASPRVDAAGKIFEKGQEIGQEIGQIKIVHFERPGALLSLGKGMWSASPAAGAMTPVADVDVQLRQAYLENSNVNPMHEMVELSRTIRHFEGLQKIAQGYDEMIGLAIQKLGET